MKPTKSMKPKILTAILFSLLILVIQGCGGRNVTAPGEESTSGSGASASNVAGEPTPSPSEQPSPSTLVEENPPAPLCQGADGQLHPGPCLDGTNGEIRHVYEPMPTPQLVCHFDGQSQSDWLAGPMAESLFNQYSANNGAELPYFLHAPATPGHRPTNAVSLSVVQFNDTNRTAAAAAAARGRANRTNSMSRPDVHNGIVLFSIPVSLPADRQSIQDDATFSAALNISFYKNDVYPADTEMLCLLNAGQHKCSGAAFVERNPNWVALNNSNFGPILNTLFNVQLSTAMHQDGNTRTGSRPLLLNLKDLFAENSRALTTSQVLDILYSGVPWGTASGTGDVVSTLNFAVGDDVMILEGTKIDLRFNKQVCPVLQVVPPSPHAETQPEAPLNAGGTNAAGVQ